MEPQFRKRRAQNSVKQHFQPNGTVREEDQNRKERAKTLKALRRTKLVQDRSLSVYLKMQERFIRFGYTVPFGLEMPPVIRFQDNSEDPVVILTQNELLNLISRQLVWFDIKDQMFISLGKYFDMSNYYFKHLEACHNAIQVFQNPKPNSLYLPTDLVRLVISFV